MATWKRAVNSQKCIRAGGKHNDLDDVGKDSYHHTFFEMLGNWSFGDYFQEEAIDYAFELLTEVYGLDKDRMYATYFEGDPESGLAEDTAAKKLWSKYLPDDHVLPGNKKDNFWEMGDVGPCGPCSELHYDRIGGRNCADLVNMDDPNVIEIWNLVFMQYNREASGKLTPLPNKHVDTGMGFERLTSILQDKMSNYDTDVFAGIFSAIQEVTGVAPYEGKFFEEDDKHIDTAYRIIGDHIRTLTFSIADGAVPSDSGRGYVLRRILRRAVRTGSTYLNAKPGFFSSLVKTVVKDFAVAFPELVENEAKVTEVIAREEELFGKTLAKGTLKFELLKKKMEARGETQLNKDDAFLLINSLGFPLDLIEIMCQEAGITVDKKGYEAKLEETKEVSRRAYAAKKGGVSFALSAAAIADLKKKDVPTTNDELKYSPGEDVNATVVAIWKGTPEDGSFVDEVKTGDNMVGIILDQTPFYAEGGGQIFDTGLLNFSDDVDAEFTFSVNDTQSYARFIAHIGRVEKGAVKVGDQIVATVDETRRLPITSNHTSTHIVNHAIRELITEEAEQRGSVVTDEKFRFDFSCPQALTAEQLKSVQDKVNDTVKQELPVYSQIVPLAEAKSIYGIRQMFGESYPDPVRVVSVGADLDQVLKDKSNEQWKNYSMEFCGGTHIANTKAIEQFVITVEEPISAGVRRIVVVTGGPARDALENSVAIEELFGEVSRAPNDKLKAQMNIFTERFSQVVIPAWKRRELATRFAGVEAKYLAYIKEKNKSQADSADSLIPDAVAKLTESGANFYVVRLGDGLNIKLLKDIQGQLLRGIQGALEKEVALCVFSESKKGKKVIASVLCSVPKALQEKMAANAWVKEICAALGGRGGGKPDVAQGNVPAENIENVIPKATELASQF
eukprot:TRINITY_DN1218_c0_g2_i1.p1 TRINITY_DN1218_c0_g2~~TRINITY_DN1218_c0_g2_i1.p1  ORF type:complete len:970 (+),score=318.70 TRINITY_DN1218_c0_g2_i1:207-2912(+)